MVYGGGVGREKVDSMTDVCIHLSYPVSATDICPTQFMWVVVFDRGSADEYILESTQDQNGLFHAIRVTELLVRQIYITTVDDGSPPHLLCILEGILLNSINKMYNHAYFISIYSG